MVKGISRQVVVVRPADTKLFEQAIFLIRDGALSRHGITDEDIIREATEEVCLRTRRKPSAFWTRAFWSGAGALFTGLLWALTLCF